MHISSLFYPDTTDECSSNPCGNDGTCIDQGTSHMCQCPAGFTGFGNCGTLFTTFNKANRNTTLIKTMVYITILQITVLDKAEGFFT